MNDHYSGEGSMRAKSSSEAALWDRIRDRWKQVRGTIAERWDKLQKQDLDTIAGDRERLIEFVHRRHGRSREEAEREVNEFLEEYQAELKSFEDWKESFSSPEAPPPAS